MKSRGYSVYGPFEIPRIGGGGRVDEARITNFWKAVENVNEGLAKASGCYIFGIRASTGSKPWYVGQAKVSFRTECFQYHKLNHYNSVLGSQGKGTPILFLIARQTQKRRAFMKRLGKGEANWVESLLILRCLAANKELLNVSGTRLAKEVILPGVFGSRPGRYRTAETQLRRMLSLR